MVRCCLEMSGRSLSGSRPSAPCKSRGIELIVSIYSQLGFSKDIVDAQKLTGH